MQKFNYEKAGCNMGDDFQARLREITPQGEMQEREREKKEQNQKRVDEYKKTLASLDPQAVEELKQEIALKIEKIEKEMFATPEEFFCYFDLDMFFAACEINDKPELAEVPFVVGFSVISTANYAARKFGIRSGMPGFLAMKLCPHLKVLKVDFPKYHEYSDRVFEILGQYDEEVVKRGIDEGYFHIRLEDPRMLEDSILVEEFIHHTVSQIKKEIKEKTNLTMSVGVSFNPRIAKMAAEKNKPDGIFILRKRKEAIYSYLDTMKIRKISGVGPQLEDILNGLDIHTIKDLRDNLWKVFSVFSEEHALSLLEDTIGYAEVGEHEALKPSISKEQTFRATDDVGFLSEKLEQLAQKLLENPRTEEFFSRNLTLKVKYFDFKSRSKSITTDFPLNTVEVLTKTACELLPQVLDRPVRLVGLKLGNLIPIEELNKKSVAEIIKESKKTRAAPAEETTAEKTDFVCPVCWKQIDVMGVKRAFERHVNDCLEHDGKIPASQPPTRTGSSGKKKSGTKATTKRSKK